MASISPSGPPTLKRVSVVGDFNNWDGRKHPMTLLGASGVWEAFIPEAREGQRYKFEVRTRHGAVTLKADPYGAAFELAPATAAIICRPEHEWQDDEWMTSRESRGSWFDKPMATYEVHLGSWGRIPEEGDRYLTYDELAKRLIPYVKDDGLHAHRAAAGDGAPVLGILGLPGDRASMRRRAGSVRRRSSRPSWTSAISTASA